MIIKKFIAGSTAFFGEGRDIDYLEIRDDLDVIYKHTVDSEGNCHHQWKNVSKEELLNYHLFENEDPMNVLSLVIPEFVNYFGFTLKELELIFSKAIRGTKRLWGVVVMDYYLQNGDLFLTDEQLKDVYKVYKREKDYEFKVLSYSKWYDYESKVE